MIHYSEFSNVQEENHEGSEGLIRAEEPGKEERCEFEAWGRQDRNVS